MEKDAQQFRRKYENNSIDVLISSPSLPLLLCWSRNGTIWTTSSILMLILSDLFILFHSKTRLGRFFLLDLYFLNFFDLTSIFYKKFSLDVNFFWLDVVDLLFCKEFYSVGFVWPSRLTHAKKFFSKLKFETRKSNFSIVNFEEWTMKMNV